MVRHKEIEMVYAALYDSYEAARDAASEDASNIRKDWDVDVKIIDLHRGFVGQIYRSRVPEDAAVKAVVVEATGPFSRHGERDYGKHSVRRAYAWVA